VKTISVCLFVAALIFACPNVDISIYSTCERHPDIHFPCCVYALLRIHLFSVLACDVLTLGFATGKRISQKLLRNCVKFLSIIHDVLKIAPMEYIKQNSDEIEIRGPESKYDSRKINSYPSKVCAVGLLFLQYTYFQTTCALPSQDMCLHDVRFITSLETTKSVNCMLCIGKIPQKSYVWKPKPTCLCFIQPDSQNLFITLQTLNFSSSHGVMCVGPRMRVNQPQRCAKN